MAAKPRYPFRPHLEALEDRRVPATFTVKNLLDNGNDAAPTAGSLRAAIKAANDTPGLDTIVFKSGLEGTILLGGEEIRIRSSLIVAGPGASKITIDGGATSGIFYVDDGLSALRNVTISGLTLFNGDAPTGGAITNTENLTVVQSVISGNRSTTSGGGIFHYLGTLTLRRTILSGNTAAESGGGLYAAGLADKLVIDRCTINNNSAALFYGGGLFTNAALTTVTGSAITNNTAASTAGGLGSNSPVVINKSVISGNRSLTGQGGGISQSGGSLNLSNSTLRANHADQGRGGGIFVNVGNAATGPVIRGCTIAENWAGSGGGLYSDNSYGLTLTLDRCVISGNTALLGVGGGVSQDAGGLTLTNSTIRGNRANQDAGGGISIISGSDATIRGCTIADNSASSGGGMFRSAGKLLINRSVLSGNIARTGDGGGVLQLSGALEISRSTVRGNHADQDRGGGLSLLMTSAASTIRDCTISENTADFGAGLQVNNSSSVDLVNSTISGNRAGTSGGGLEVYQQPLANPVTLQNCTVVFNQAGTSGFGFGGGIRNNPTSQPAVRLQSTLVALNSTTGGSGPDLSGAFDVQFSLLGTNSDVPVNDQGNNLPFGLDPLLAPLANNGGLTQTHALKKGSPAINKGLNFAASPFDQRGAPFKRQVGGAVDIGAFERQ